MAVNQNPVLSRAPPPHPCYKPLCRGLLLHSFVANANAWRWYALRKKNLVAKVLVASQEILLQIYVAEWPPKPVTNPVFLIHSHIEQSRMAPRLGLCRDDGRATTAAMAPCTSIAEVIRWEYPCKILTVSMHLSSL